MNRTRTITVGSVAAVLLAAALALATTTGLVGADRSSSGTPDAWPPATSDVGVVAEPATPEAAEAVVAPTTDHDDEQDAEDADRPVAPAPVRAEDDDD